LPVSGRVTVVLQVQYNASRPCTKQLQNKSNVRSTPWTMNVHACTFIGKNMRVHTILEQLSPLAQLDILHTLTGQ